MKESKPVVETGIDQGPSHVRAVNKATVPVNELPAHRAVTHSVGHYIERSSTKSAKGLRRERY